MSLPLPTFYKHPTARLPIYWDWAVYRAELDISGYDIDIPAGLEVIDDALNGRRVDVVVEGGTAGQVYEVTCTITLDNGEFDSRTFRISVLKL